MFIFKDNLELFKVLKILLIRYNRVMFIFSWMGFRLERIWRIIRNEDLSFKFDSFNTNSNEK